jgi:hypothetical protein
MLVPNVEAVVLIHPLVDILTIPLLLQELIPHEIVKRY